MAADTQSPIDTYLDAVADPEAQRALTVLRNQLRRLLPEATETLSYGMPAYRLENGKVAAGFAFFGKNCGYYPHSGNIVPKLARLLAEYKTTPGAVSFPPGRPLKANVVKALVRARLEEIAALAQTPSSPRARAAAKRVTAAPRTRKPAARRAPKKD